MRVAEVRKYCQLPEEGQRLMRSAMAQLQLSARAYHRILKLARTIADLAGSEEIGPAHLAEALQYRPKLWTSRSGSIWALRRAKRPRRRARRPPSRRRP